MDSASNDNCGKSLHNLYSGWSLKQNSCIDMLPLATILNHTEWCP